LYWSFLYWDGFFIIWNTCGIVTEEEEVHRDQSQKARVKAENIKDRITSLNPRVVQIQSERNKNKMSNSDNNLALFRNLSIFLNSFAIIQLLFAVVLPDILDPLIKTWILLFLGIIFLGLIFSLILIKTKDTTTLLFLIILSVFISGFVSGVSLLVIVGKVKKWNP
jgi:hypothetical protein